ncbi:MAG: hypothetical protein HY939_02065, partial [Gammaproteobacteria bacterium]|nr:hypothetical protein [Gammaproteobacteria bacterium]
LLEDKKIIEKNIKQAGELAIKFFNYALSQEDVVLRFEMVNQAAEEIKILAKYDSKLAGFLLARKKMTNYRLLEDLVDYASVKFTVNDCELLHRRYCAFDETALRA